MAGKKKKSKFWKNNRQFFVGFGMGLMLCLGVIIGIPLSVDTSMINNLQHYDQTIRTNDMFEPIAVGTDMCQLWIEVTAPFLCYAEDPIAPDIDYGRMLIVYGRVQEPIFDEADWVLRGEVISHAILWGDSYRQYCDTPDGTDTYLTHFEMLWSGLPSLEEDYTYVLYMEFFDANDKFYGCPEFNDNNPLSDWWFDWEDQFQEGDMQLAEDSEPVGDLTLCDNFSFFYYDSTLGIDDGDNGDAGDTQSWLQQYTIFAGMQNWVAVTMFSLVGIVLATTIIMIAVIVKKRKS